MSWNVPAGTAAAAADRGSLMRSGLLARVRSFTRLVTAASSTSVPSSAPSADANSRTVTLPETGPLSRFVSNTVAAYFPPPGVAAVAAVGSRLSTRSPSVAIVGSGGTWFTGGGTTGSGAGTVLTGGFGLGGAGGSVGGGADGGVGF